MRLSHIRSKTKRRLYYNIIQNVCAHHTTICRGWQLIRLLLTLWSELLSAKLTRLSRVWRLWYSKIKRLFLVHWCQKIQCCTKNSPKIVLNVPRSGIIIPNYHKNNDGRTIKFALTTKELRFSSPTQSDHLFLA